MNRTNTSKILVGLVLLAVGLVSISSMGSAALLDDTISLSDPDGQTVETNVSWSGSTDVTASLKKDGTVVESTTVSGASGDTKTLSLDGTGLAKGDYSLSVSASDESVATVDNSRLVTVRDSEIDIQKNESVAVDVAFDSVRETNATLKITDSGTVLNQTKLSFDPVEFEDGSGVKTHTWQAGQNYSAVNATIEVTPASGQSQVWVSKHDDTGLLTGGGIAFGANRNQIIAFLAVVAGIVFARSNNWI